MSRAIRWCNPERPTSFPNTSLDLLFALRSRPTIDVRKETTQANKNEHETLKIFQLNISDLAQNESKTPDPHVLNIIKTLLLFNRLALMGMVYLYPHPLTLAKTRGHYTSTTASSTLAARCFTNKL
jgi:hypothetical protein